MKNNTHGFTLIELLIVVAIIGIISAFAYPSYQKSVTKSRRADAQGALASFANAMSQWYLQNDSSYCNAAVAGATHNALCPAGTTDEGAPRIFSATVPIAGGTTTYNLTIQAATATTFTLRATPTGVQTNDGYLELTELGAKRWDKNHDGDTGDAGETTWDN